MLTKLKPSNIDLDKLSETLEDDYNFAREGKNDVSAVGGVSSKFIARAATRTVGSNEVLVSDRTLVDKALFLYDTDNDTTVSAAEVVKASSIDNIINDSLDNTQLQVNSNVSDEILSIRSELYGLINNLSKKGLLRNYYVDNGFVDPFNELDSRCSVEYLCDVVQTGNVSAGFTQHIYVSKDDASKIIPGSWYMVEKIFSTNDVLNEIIYVSAVQYGSSNIVDCTVLDYDLNEVGLSLKNINDLYSEMPTMRIKGFHGQYVNNTFSFSKTDKYVETGNQNEISFDDDSVTITVPAIDTDSNPAFAFSCRVPANKIGALKTFSIYGIPTGDASDLQCYILKDSSRVANASNVIERFSNNDPLIIARSRQVFLANVNTTDLWRGASKLTFDFSNESDGKYKTSLENDTYLFVIVKTNNTAGGSWEFLFSRNPQTNNDVQTNNKCYTYWQDVSDNYVFTDKEYNYDLMYSIITETVLNEKEVGFTNGLYTSEPFYFSNRASDIDVSLVVNREGLLKTASTTTVNGSNNDPIVIEVDSNISNYNDNLIGYSYGIKSGDTIVVGDNVLTVKRENSDNRIFANEDDIHITMGDKVYKVGYKVNLLLYRKDSLGEDIVDNYSLALNKVVPNEDKTIDNASDKLVFKANDIVNSQPTFGTMNTFDKLYYKGIVSIAWESDAPIPYFEEGQYSNDNFIGRIYNLTVASSGINNVKVI